MSNKIPIISFFTGGGFLDIGFEQAGFETVFTNEYDTDFAKLYEEGMTSWALSEKKDRQYKISSTDSITDLTPSQIESLAFPQGKPEIWGIIGGPPCQDFSLNGAMNGFGGVRGKMTMVFFNRIKKMQPAFFVMENVVGMLRKKDTKETVARIIENNCSSDYYISKFILNALDYGVPQNRERVFIVGFNKEMFELSHLINESEDIYSLDFPLIAPRYPNAKKRYNWPTQNKFGEVPALDKSIPIELTVTNCLVSEKDKKNKVANIDEYFPLRRNAEERKKVNEGDTNRPSFKRLHRYRFSPTTCYGNNEVHLHPYENRRISVREALRIQGVPDSYEFSKNISLSKKFKLIGNGVPVPLAKAVAKSVLHLISDKDNLIIREKAKCLAVIDLF